MLYDPIRPAVDSILTIKGNVIVLTYIKECVLSLSLALISIIKFSLHC